MSNSVTYIQLSLGHREAELVAKILDMGRNMVRAADRFALERISLRLDKAIQNTPIPIKVEVLSVTPVSQDSTSGNDGSGLYDDGSGKEAQEASGDSG